MDCFRRKDKNNNKKIKRMDLIVQIMLIVKEGVGSLYEGVIDVIILLRWSPCKINTMMFLL